jgi:hypothetical protein
MTNAIRPVHAASQLASGEAQTEAARLESPAWEEGTALRKPVTLRGSVIKR